MKTKTLIPLIMGVVVGGAAIKMVVDAINTAEGAGRADMTQCVVAKMDFDFAEEMTPEKLVLVDWPKSSLPMEYFSSKEELVGRVTSMFIPKDVPVYPTMLAPSGTPPGIQTRIPPGFRAVSVEINEVSGVAYMLKPGDRVDVVSLVRRRNPRRGNRDALETLSRMILQNVEIAAVGRTLARSNRRSGGGKGAMITRSVTLVLKPDEVTKLHLARENGGRISLALRGIMDEEKSHVAAATNEWLLGSDALEESEPADDKVQELVGFQPVRHRSWRLKFISGNDIRFLDYERVNGKWVLQNGSLEGLGAPTGPSRPADGAANPEGDFGKDRNPSYSKRS